jgi:hypothetical protein
MNVTRITHYIELVSQVIGIGLAILAFKYLAILPAIGITVGIVIVHLCFCALLSKWDDWYLGKAQAVMDKVTKTEDQIDDFIHDWVNNEEKTTSKEHFEETKNLLMADWMDSHSESTRMDFQKYFDYRMECSCAPSLPRRRQIVNLR